jgi:hypothetical protein
VKQHADALLQEAGLVARLQNYGEVLFAGSYAIDFIYDAVLRRGITDEQAFLEEIARRS